MKISVGVLFGGNSVEHEVSVISASQAMHALNKEKYNVVPIYITKDCKFYTGDALLDIKKYKDIPALLAECEEVVLKKGNNNAELVKVKGGIFGKKVVAVCDMFIPVVHGTNVEDGTLQGYLEMLGVPYGGCDVTASALGMDKYAMKCVLRDAGVNVLDAVCFYSREYYKNGDKVIESIENKLSYPVIVKPVNLGSSVGIKVAKNREGLVEAIDEAATFSQKVLVERAIEKLKEVNCSVLGDYEDCSASVLEEPVSSGGDILDFKDKYQGGSKNGDGGSKGMSGSSRKVPAEVTKEQEEAIKEMCLTTFKALNCNGVARIDVMIDEESGEIFVNEINTIPGSLSFYLWEAAGLSFDKLMDKIIYYAQKRHREREKLSFSYDTNLLSEFGARSLKNGAKGAKN
ncbi:MAG: D-alanine--D-alanine ligase [Clostridia bacterium]|nr:D-alanine--D-alanine ligase [Clostridia bacterium]